MTKTRRSGETKENEPTPLTWWLDNIDRMREAYEECDRAECVLGFASQQQADEHLLYYAALDLLRAAVAAIEDQETELAEDPVVTLARVNCTYDLNKPDTASFIGRAADALKIGAADIVRRRIPWESIPTHRNYDAPAPFERTADGTPMRVFATDFEPYYKAAGVLRLDRERAAAATLKVLDAIEAVAIRDEHAAAKLARAREIAHSCKDWDDASAALMVALCALAERVVCTCCKTLSEELHEKPILDAEARVAEIAVPILRELLPEAAELVDRYAEPEDDEASDAEAAE